MKWTEVTRELALDHAQEAHCRGVIVRLQEAFERVCSRPWSASADSPTSTLSRYIVSTQADAFAASTHLLSLLQRVEPGNTTRLRESAALSDGAFDEFASVLREAQRARWRELAPDNLLDIDLDAPSAFDRALVARIAALQRPEGFLCTSPFEYMHIQANGDVYPCCPSKFGRIIGNLTTQTLEEVWHSAAATEVRESMLDGSYRFCNASACEYLRDAIAREKPLAPAPLVAWARANGVLDERRSPRVVNFAFDRTCNLACSYCRATPFRPTAADRRDIQRIDANIFESLLEGTERIILLGEGDPFASPFYRERLRTYDWSRHPQLRIKIQTNGLLLTPAMWDSIAKSHEAIDWVSVSVDAATAETYRINRGGDFDLLVRNLEFIAELFAQHKLRHFHLNFLAQANNYREIPAFARLGQRLGCDLIEFQRFENWGTYSDADFHRYAIHEPEHPEHFAFREMLADDALRHPAVWTLKLGDCAPAAASVDLIAYDSTV